MEVRAGGQTSMCSSAGRGGGARQPGAAQQQPLSHRRFSMMVSLQTFSGTSGFGHRRGSSITCAANSSFPGPKGSGGGKGKGSQGGGKEHPNVRYEWKWYDRLGPPGGLKNGPGAKHQTSFHKRGGSASGVWNSADSTDVPSAANLPGKDVEDSSNDGYESPEEEFRRCTEFLPRNGRSAVNLILEGGSYCEKLSEVYVILFGVGETSTEGIYSLRSLCDQTGLHIETIICFESNEDAFRFSGLLEATMTHAPSVHTIRPKDLVKFCEDSGYACRLEPKGSMMMPPEFNVGITDWERSMRLREGKFKVLEQEPDIERKALTASPLEEAATEEGGEMLRRSFDEARHVEMSDSIAMELDEVRAMLERLLPEE